MKGEYNILMSTGMDCSDSYPKSRTACFDIGISGNCIGNCLICRAFNDDYAGRLSDLNKKDGNVLELFQELLDKGYIDMDEIRNEWEEQ